MKRSCDGEGLSTSRGTTFLAGSALAVVAVLSVGRVPTAGAGPLDLESTPASSNRIVEVFSPDGSIDRVALPEASPEEERTYKAAPGTQVTPLHVSGPSSNRFDIVIVGDGYTQSEMGLFHQHARSKWEAIKAVEPFTSYRSYFNVWMIDVVSNESGVDNDPLPGTMRDTALDMQFWCSGTERLLCMNQAKAQPYAELAPQADQVLGLANSTKYGGAGGAYATSSGGHAAAGQITVHELGHSIGGLADEYDYYYRLGLAEDSNEDVRLPVPYLVYTGGEPAAVNTSAQQHQSMLTSKIKWWRWLGEPSPDGTAVSTYEGGGYYKYGLYRPTENSLMKSLGKPFNLPSREKMTQSFYVHVDPIDAAPPRSIPLDGVNPVTIRVLQPASHDLQIDWFLDGELVSAASGATTFEFPSQNGVRHSSLRVRVVDPTPFVRDPAYVDKFLTQQITWTIAPR